ncbi:PHA/PHB synthase family protein [Xanthomonas hortorum]|uniref:Alpha/beta fold hydrolase n=1 Tax=Xanthomonas hortorum pv. hederae TaxID=453603 RepID=A0A9X4BUP4_9XANT|nr:alpha/beta fold hydrolase [Xanthomonas hortorum]MCE4372370.1 alpha/beta fold hydrolase [Xanthomonas hortorum pv. hederae]MDC8639833.1 alpha/beta fold hydrolase [Xanthomonas hortorum pv. hederae]PPU79408.1 poly-beta-hydroxybutyrate polymerase [Xanthomonas hortorum pv. hederae]PUE99102.1 poly-beta-hydroxybutyrate polymerase [Xanthomonas hortorum pv. hederae]
MHPGNASSAQEINVQARATLAGLTSSLSPQSGVLAWLDWVSHLALAPGKQSELCELALRQASDLAGYLRQCLLAGPGEPHACIEPPARDRRFADPEWRHWPFNLWHQAFLLNQHWWEEATRAVPGVDRHHEKVADFAARQCLDLFSPGNVLATNPVALRRTVSEGGANLQRGLRHLLDDLRRHLGGFPPAGTEDFVVGRDVAVTPGKVVLRNRLIELIQYTPTTATVHPEPVLVIPAWIMKYYILDLSPHNSLVKYLVDQGFTVFCLSWKNPGADERELGMDDYLRLGLHAALTAINTIRPKRKVHAAGYCLGGTLLSIAAAAMARDGDERLASLSLFAAQTDFSEPGELGLFIDESQVSLLEAQMQEKGYLRAEQMAGAFQMLRSYDLLWSKMVNDYLLGDRRPLNDLMAWNADATRMPARMHSQYLRRLFLDDDLSEGRYPVDGRPVSLGGITLPVFSVGTEADHVAPWRSVHKLHYLSPAELTFVLASGGHNAGIVSEPGHPRRSYRIQTRRQGDSYLDADAWREATQPQEGSWWPEWTTWLRERSGAPVKPPRTSAKGYPVLGDAPGRYVLEK